jgi:16S rRNA (guanine966-N2)-methyltransferase
VRIIGGVLSGRRLAPLKVQGIRPTTDRVREALGSALDARAAIVGRRVLDLFAGSGALGLEALSRGASSVLAVDHSRPALRYVSEAARTLGVAQQLETLALDLLERPVRVLPALERRGPFGLVFIDPPYAELDALLPLLAALGAAKLLEPDAIVVLEHSSRTPAPEVAGLERLASYRYGDTSVALLGPIA